MLAIMVCAGNAWAQQRMEVGGAPPPNRVPSVVWVNGYSPDNSARGVFYDIRPSAAQLAYASKFSALTHEEEGVRSLFADGSEVQPLGTAPPSSVSPAPVAPGSQAAVISFETQSFDDNITTTGGSIFIPPDSHGAPGPSDVVVVNNVSLASYDKTTGAVSGLALQSFKTFFGSTTFTFDPKVVYDHFSNRFVVVTLEREDVAAFGDPADASRILLAASPVGTPAGTWIAISIDAKTTIGADATWCDYPGLAVDEEAIYITCNHFKFGSSPGSSVGQRLRTIDKASFYAGTFSDVTDLFIYDPATAVGGFDVTMMPAQVHSDPGGTIGTWLVGYSGLSDGTNESYQVIRIDSPLGGAGASFTLTFVSLGDVDDVATAFADAEQSGTATRIDTGDRRLLDAVWRTDRLWGVATMIPSSGADAGHETAHFVQMDTSTGTPSLVNQGNAGGEELGTTTYTFYPSIAVNNDCAIMGFAATNAAMFPGAYYVGINPLTAAVGGTITLRTGDDFYVRTFGGSDNRWGDYTSTTLDFDDEASFWIFNEYAQTRGTIVSGEDGRWGQRAAEEICGGVLPVELEGFSALVEGRTVTLAWRTQSETNNAGFEVEMRAAAEPGKTWRAVGFVPGAGTTSEAQAYTFRVEDIGPGPYLFRLKQRDFDGTFVYSPEVEVFVELPEAFVLSDAFPNPFNPQTQFTLMVRNEQRVRVAVFDALGREVARLHDGPLAPNTAHRFTFEASGLPSGLYVYRVEGETFSASKLMTLVK
ncbi:T9SS type A sorting domain-containing protein [Rhodocaloribacter sp.]